MKKMKTFSLLATIAAVLSAAPLAQAGSYKIGGFTFDDANTVKTAFVVEGPVTLMDHSNKPFGKYSEEYISSGTRSPNEFKDFDRSKSIARLMQRASRDDSARHICLPDSSEGEAVPNVNRSTIEFNWKDMGLPNGPGKDLVVFESGSWEGFVVSVRKAGSDEFASYRYQFPAAVDSIHGVNAVAFDFSDFGLAEGDVVAAVRIRNIFNGAARLGGDKVDKESGEGNVIYPGDPRYKTASTLRSGPTGAEFKTEDLDADVVYVAGLHDIIKLPAPAAQK